MDENLAGYLLKLLEPDEHHAVETRLAAHPELRAKLELLERTLAPLAADAEDPVPPPGLALSALARIAEHKCRPLPSAPRPTRGQFTAPGWLRMRRVDLLVAAALLILVGGLMLPALTRAWYARDRIYCQNNLRTIWSALEDYSDQSPNRGFPMVEAQGPRSLAGAFVPLLHDAGVLNETTPVSCPALGDRPPVNVSLSDLEKAFQSGGDGFDELARKLSGGYAYTLGYRDGPVLAGLRASDPDTLPILADLPAGEGNSPNHGRLGQNVLYIGGNVRWCTQRTVGQAGDDIYVNKHNLLRAGEGRSDTVLGPGDACPSGSE